MKARIYLDYAASTPLDAKVFKEMLPYLKKHFGNPSSLHQFGQKARAAIEKARETAAKFLRCAPMEIFFTSGATEANNLAIQGLVKSLQAKEARRKPHIIVSAIEHESVLSSVKELELRGEIEATYVKPQKNGIINADDVKNALKDDTALVSVMAANSEIGAIQPIAKIGSLLSAHNVARGKRRVLFHADFAQAAHWMECDVKAFGVDLLTLSSHKMYGPKGAGLLYIKEGTALAPLASGGNQEYGMRSGTENVAAIVGFGAAIGQLMDPRLPVANIRIRQMRDKLIKSVLRSIPDSLLTGSLEARLPNNAHFLFRGVRGKDLATALDQEGIAVSTGSACSEKMEEPSHVLLALGVEPELALGSLRVTLGRQTRTEDIEKTVKALKKTVTRLRLAKRDFGG